MSKLIMSKKIVTIILAMLLCFGAAACGADTSGRADEDDSSATTPAAVSDGAAGEDDTTDGAIDQEAEAPAPDENDSSGIRPAGDDDSAAQGADGSSGEANSGGASSKSGISSPDSSKDGSSNVGTGSTAADKKTGSKKSSDTKKDEKDKPKSTPAAKPGEKETDITVTVGVDCKTLAADDPDLADKLSEDGVILAAKSVTIKSGESALAALKASGISYVGTSYVSSINGLSEMDAGPKSGWVYSVNGVYPGVGVAGYKPKDGDNIQFRYTLNGGADVKAVIP
jgi:hypothetical protein